VGGINSCEEHIQSELAGALNAVRELTKKQQRPLSWALRVWFGSAMSGATHEQNLPFPIAKHPYVRVRIVHFARRAFRVGERRGSHKDVEDNI
jgi:hypothetical protein